MVNEGHNSCTNDGDYLTLLIKTDSTRKQEVEGGNKGKNDGWDKIVVVFLITEINTLC